MVEGKLREGRRIGMRVEVILKIGQEDRAWVVVVGSSYFSNRDLNAL